MKDHLLLIHHCNLHNHYKNHKRTIFEYNCQNYIEIGHYGTIFLNIRQNQLKTTKQIYWIPDILPYYSAKTKNPVFLCFFFFLFVIAAIVTCSCMTAVVCWYYHKGRYCKMNNYNEKFQLRFPILGSTRKPRRKDNLLHFNCTLKEKIFAWRFSRTYFRRIYIFNFVPLLRR